VKFRAIFIAIAVTSMLWSPVHALYFEEYIVNIVPVGDLAHETVSFLVVNDDSSSMSAGNYTIGTRVEDVRVTDDKGLLQFSVESSDDFTVITYDYRSPISPGGSSEITVFFKATGIVGLSTFVDAEGSRHEDRVVATGFSAPGDIRKMEVMVRLPAEAWLPRSLGERETAAGSPVQPLDAQILTNGTNLVLTWSRQNLNLGDRFDLLVAYNFPGQIIRTSPLTIMIALLSGIGLGSLSVFLLLRGRKREERTKHTMALLEEGERKILKTIMGRGGEVRQDELLEATGYSKARVSQLVTRLEKLGLVRKEKFERTNKLFATEE
jgi:uncharacterized membrane protein